MPKELFKDFTLILNSLLLIFKVYGTSFDGFFLRIREIICSIQNETDTPDKLPWVFICTLQELDISNKLKKN